MALKAREPARITDAKSFTDIGKTTISQIHAIFSIELERPSAQSLTVAL